MGGGPERRCVVRVYGLVGAVRLHQLGISHYFMLNMHGQTTLKFPNTLFNILIYQTRTSQCGVTCAKASNKHDTE